MASQNAVATLVELHGSGASIASGLIGHIIGVVTQYGENHQSKRVNHDNKGTPSSTLNPSPIGYPRTTGSFPGASGAQFIGKLIQALPAHPPQPPSSSYISCAVASISATLASS